MRFEPGSRLGPYEILRSLGAGGMGEVYLAQDTRLGRKVAIKFILPEVDANETAKKRLLREAQSAAKLDHPNVCAVHEVGEQDGHSFVVMQYVEGELLSTRMKRKPLELKEALDIAIQIADALAEAHEHGLIHRDIKPENVMVTARSHVKVMDFGLAKEVEVKGRSVTEAQTQSRITGEGLVVGTVPYMSPEQVQGEPLDTRSDIFSYGALLYEMVTGVQPFLSNNTAAIISNILNQEPFPLARFVRETPVELERIVSKALRKNKDQRYQSIKDLLIDLRTLRDELEFTQKLKRSEGSVEVSKPVTESPVAPARTVTLEVSRRNLFITSASIAVVLAALAAFYFLYVRRTASIDSLAVLPFVNASGQPQNDYLSDGITESLISSLSKLPQLTVMSRNAVFHYKSPDPKSAYQDAQAIGRELKVKAVLTGNVVQRGNSLIISTELVDVNSNRQLWGEQYNRKFADVFEIQEAISREISDRLRLKLSGKEKELLAKRYTQNVEAYQLYLKGRYFWYENAVGKAEQYFQEATHKDPQYSLAYAGLADVFSGRAVAGELLPKDAYPKAEAHVKKALELDDQLADAHAALGIIRLFYNWDWSGAEKESKRALELAPNDALPHATYAFYLQTMGRFEEAIEERKRAIELDPQTRLHEFNLGRTYFFARKYDQTIEVIKKMIAQDPTRSPSLLAEAYEQKGMYKQALDVWKKVYSGDPEVQAILSRPGADQDFKGTMLAVCQQDLKNFLNAAKTEYVSPEEFFYSYLCLGDKEKALEWLEKGYQERNRRLIDLKVDPHYDLLRSDPRFQNLVRRVGLP